MNDDDTNDRDAVGFPDHVSEHLLWVGTCINQWAQLETSLFDLFRVTLRVSEEFAAIIYYRDHRFSAKLQLVEELVEVSLINDPDRTAWRKLCVKIREKSEYRNRAAHSHLWRERQMVVGPAGLESSADTGFIAAKHSSRMVRPREKQSTLDIAGMKESVRIAGELQKAIVAKAQELRDAFEVETALKAAESRDGKA